MKKPLPKICLDARLYGPTHTGIGRYVKNLVLALPQQPQFKDYSWSCLVYENLKNEIEKDTNSQYEIIPTSITHYSLQEQLKLPILLNSHHFDLVHFTHFNKPLLYQHPSIITIHDLIKHFYRGKGTTTRSPLLYWPKYLGYRFLVNQNINQAAHIIVPSAFWKKYLVNNFHLSPSKITVTHEAVDPQFLPPPKETVSLPKNYLLYTGNLYPHKNIKVIFKALQLLPDLSLKIISKPSPFSEKIKREAQTLKVDHQIEFLGFVPDREFKKLYQNALALVHPSFMEGFSLTGLEAMALNCPVISSNTSCLPEIYQDSVLYFNPRSPQDLSKKIKKLLENPSLRQKLIKKGHQQLTQYSWEKTAKETLQAYQKVLSPSL